MQNHSNENAFDLHENGGEGGIHFHMNGFTCRLVLKQRQRATQKWPVHFTIAHSLCQYLPEHTAAQAGRGP